ncbi:MAG: hypothetical protein QOK47_894, partial [Actinomycetota bacterium]|nr:hypothetical protein [Actinomycetota bacterium]
MRPTARVLGLLILTLTLLPAAPAAGVRTQVQGNREAIDSVVITPPTSLAATDRRNHLVYEIFVHNRSASRVRLDRVAVRDATDRAVVETLGAAEIKSRTFRYGRSVNTTRIIQPNDFVIMMMDVGFGGDETIPTSLDHRVAMTLMKAGKPRHMKLTIAPTEVDDRSPISLSPPLHEENLAVLGCCSAPFAHRLAVLLSPQGALVPQRYAIDLVQLDDDVSTYEGDPSDNESYFIYGAEAVAVAPGEVVATRNDMSENTLPNTRPGVSRNELAGNHVVLDLGDGRFALYAHFQPGSVTVEPGDHVESGQVLGLVGNSGNSSEPHLHFHLMDGSGGDSALEADGLPYVFDNFRFESRVTGLDGKSPVGR